MAERILIVDDEERIRKLLVMYLEKEGYIVDEADNGQDGLERLKYMDYSCVLLDVHLPMLNGKTILTELRKTKATPVIIMSAQADDYVIKPFSPRELMLRVNAILQRTKRSVFYTPELYTKDVLVFPGLIIDVNSHKVIVDDTEIFLTPKEFDLLMFLAKSPDKAFRRNEILRAVWNYDFYTDLRTVDTHIKRVRKKIAKISPKVAQMITTVWGIGYKFDTSLNSL
ncbi:response regulator transcription factor [Gemella bergeri]